MFNFCAIDGKLMSTVGAILNLVLIAIPKDLWRWLNLRDKCVKGQVVVITGGGSGLGQRMAEIFALELGAKVAVVDINEENAKSVTDNIRLQDGIAKAWKGDVANSNSMNTIAADVRKCLGKVNIVICNAGILYFAHTLQLKTEEIQHALNVNVMGTINTIRAFLEDMEENNSGHIVGISSIAGYYGETYGMAYCPTKFAVRGIMDCLRMELHDRKVEGIACTTMCPYFVRTPMILNKKMRPTSRLIPFMSIEKCSRKIIDAILKEKILAFVPTWISLMPMVTTLLSVNMQKTCRDYLNCHYEPIIEEDTKFYECQHCKKLINFYHFPNNDNKEKNNEKKINGLYIDVTPIKKSCERMINKENCCCCSSQFVNNNCNKFQSKSQAFQNKQFCGTKNSLSILSRIKPRSLPTTQTYSMSNYNKTPSFKWFLIIPPALALTFFVWYAPQVFEVWYLGFVGKFLHYLGTKYSTLLLLINICAWIVHFAEAEYALIICARLDLSHACSLKWFIQTFVLGFPSLSLLFSYRRKKLLSK